MEKMADCLTYFEKFMAQPRGRNLLNLLLKNFLRKLHLEMTLLQYIGG